MCLFGYNTVGRSYEVIPVRNSIISGKNHGNNWTRAHEGSQAGKVGCSILVCIKIAAKLWTQLEFPLLPGESDIQLLKGFVKPF